MRSGTPYAHDSAVAFHGTFSSTPNAHDSGGMRHLGVNLTCIIVRWHEAFRSTFRSTPNTHMTVVAWGI